MSRAGCRGGSRSVEMSDKTHGSVIVYRFGRVDLVLACFASSGVFFVTVWFKHAIHAPAADVG